MNWRMEKQRENYFQTACREGDFNFAKSFIDDGIDIHCNKNAPLWLSARTGNLELVKLLLKMELTCILNIIVF